MSVTDSSVESWHVRHHGKKKEKEKKNLRTGTKEKQI
jgi:hypothetical protein